jgi:hypothetical protein
LSPILQASSLIATNSATILAKTTANDRSTATTPLKSMLIFVMILVVVPMKSFSLIFIVTIMLDLRQVISVVDWWMLPTPI